MHHRGIPRGFELFQPMLAVAGKDLPADGDWVFEPKYDGIRVLALVTPDAVGLITRNGHDKRRQFPEITNALGDLSRALDRNLVLDGEIVALDESGEPARFQELQGRMHLSDVDVVRDRSAAAPSGFIAFDILVDGSELLATERWDERRRSLQRVMRAAPRGAKRLLRISTVEEDDPDRLLREAREAGWEGVMAKRRDCPYEPGRRVRHWLKLKIENRQEFVVAGWTEPRGSRAHFGALLLGYYDDQGKLVYAGHTGTGFSHALLDAVYRKLKAIERKDAPFVVAPKTNEPAHWVKPQYVAEVKFNEWTAGGNLRQPVFLGLRDDKDPREIVREPASALREKISGNGRGNAADGGRESAGSARRKPRRAASAAAKRTPAKTPHSVVQQLRANPKAASATLQLDKSSKFEVTNLGKVFFPGPRFTKGRLMEYYAEVAPHILRALEDRPLVLRRFPNGITGGAFYQQKAPPKVPAGVRVEKVADEGISTQRRLIGGNLATLLYIVQLGAISMDPWHSRVQSIADADYSIIDLDPGPGAKFKRVVQVARWVKEELDELGLHAVPKTSGASGIHIVLPLPPGASYELARTLAELVARRVHERHPKETTVHRWVKSRPSAAVYVDYLQNIRGKTVASVYAARAEKVASVSAPLRWNELADELDPRDFTIETLPPRLASVGDIWATGMRRVNDLPGVLGGGGAAA